MSDIIFYTHPWSRGRVTRWMLEECQADYTTKVLEYGTTMKDNSYLAINPMGKVPALKHGDTIITENAAICAYLADQFPQQSLAPKVDSPARGDYYRWLFFIAGPLEAAAISKSLGLLAPADKSSTAGYGTFDDVVNTLEKTLTNTTYLCGEQFSAADLYMAANLGWYLEFDLIPKLECFQQYVEKHRNREAARKAFEMDEALAKEYPVPS